jgi:hypothetical protein
MAKTPLEADYHSARNNSMSRRGSGELVVQCGATGRRPHRVDNSPKNRRTRARSDSMIGEQDKWEARERMRDGSAPRERRHDPATCHARLFRPVNPLIGDVTSTSNQTNHVRDTMRQDSV